MAKYTHQAGAHWPDSLIDLTNYKDADNTVGSLVAEIKALQEAGSFDEAQALITQHPELKQYSFDSAAINKYVEELRNLQIYTRTHKQQIFYTTEEEAETYCDTNDVWIGDNGGGEEVATGNASPFEVLEGSTFSSSSGINQLGTMPNIGMIEETIDPGETYHIPAGYHNGSGTVTANGAIVHGKIQNIGKYEANGMHEVHNITGDTVKFEVAVPTIMSATIVVAKGKTEVNLPRDISTFVYLTGYSKDGGTTVVYSGWMKAVNGKWYKKNSSGDYCISAVNGSTFTISWNAGSTITYWAW